MTDTRTNNYAEQILTSLVSGGPRALFFRFEEDFVADGVRCIPMVVRFKLDACGVKLKLKEWSKMDADHRVRLATQRTDTRQSVALYKEYLCKLIVELTGNAPTLLEPEICPEWTMMTSIPGTVQQKLDELELSLTLEQWRWLTALQRFALVKLSRPGHENANFPRAVLEFTTARKGAKSQRIQDIVL